MRKLTKQPQKRGYNKPAQRYAPQSKAKERKPKGIYPYLAVGKVEKQNQHTYCGKHTKGKIAYKKGYALS